MSDLERQLTENCYRWLSEQISDDLDTASNPDRDGEGRLRYYYDARDRQPMSEPLRVRIRVVVETEKIG